jgi:hypothetical protein
MPSLVAAWFRTEDKNLLARVCNDRRECMSDFVRRAVMRELFKLSYGTTEEKKSLEVSK